MSALSIRLPESLHTNAKELAQREGISVNHHQCRTGRETGGVGDRGNAAGPSREGKSQVQVRAAPSARPAGRSGRRALIDGPGFDRSVAREGRVQMFSTTVSV